MSQLRIKFLVLSVLIIYAGPIHAESTSDTMQRIEQQLTEYEESMNLEDTSSAAVAARRIVSENRSQRLKQRIETDRQTVKDITHQITQYVDSLLQTSLSNVPAVTGSGADGSTGTRPLAGASTTLNAEIDDVIEDMTVLLKDPGPAIAPGPAPISEPVTELEVNAADAVFQLPKLPGMQSATPLEGTVAGLKRRVLTRPDALLYRLDGKKLTLDTFSILYVYHDTVTEDSVRWLAVGVRADRVDGWVRYDATEDWRSMLVMEYGPRTNIRKPVLFFSEKDQLASVVSDEGGFEMAQALYDKVSSGDNADGQIVTVEPNRSVGRDETYLMPILDFEASYFGYGDYAETTLLQLAGLTDDSVSRQDVATGVAEFNAKPDVSKSLERFRIGVAFVIDTTRSMGPYINATKDFVRNVYSRLASKGLDDKFRFALVGFRDNVEVAPGADYVTRIFSDLDGGETNQEMLEQIDSVSPADTPTIDWREDAFAGLRTAAYDLDWSPVDARIVVLITDASARSETDGKARHRMFGAWSVRAIMDQNDISVFSVHLRTDEARKVAGEAEIYRGQAQYTTLGRYLPVEGNTSRAFGRALDSMENLLIQTLSDAAKGLEMRDGISEEDRYKVIDVLLGRDVVTEETAEIVAEPIASEIFRYQQAYLGEFEGVRPPKFYRAWAADLDLLNQSQEALTVSVLISRGQLELLADALQSIVADVDSKAMNLSEFHSGTQLESGRTAVDPKLPDVAKEFLEALPYKSKFLKLTGDGFRGLGQGQQDLLNEVRAKLSGYREVLSSDKRWMRVNEASEEELYPLPLRNLP